MMETIDVVYRPVQGTREGVYHKYLLYTSHTGEQFYASSYPQHYTPLEMLANLGLGRIEAFIGPYDARSRDWDLSLAPGSTATPHARENVAEASSLALQWGAITHRMGVIDAAQIPYTLEQRNSNTAIDSALRAAGLAEPQLDDPGEYWAPGSGYPLPLPAWYGVRDWLVNTLVDALARVDAAPAAQGTVAAPAPSAEDTLALTLIGTAPDHDHFELI